ncbi:cold-regulated 413 inner membrane protein 1, chloroplastic-like [Pyrus x bretschneideri]|uniref:cold-regulated 413 inner membrane protein 1, chloroplastic-like n=1 Tax=Pyrus x bretschneideri TaxID=225117 RepID=UPI00202EC6EB|nr:cold-regulated 413 inner membrane protein 1, chloroplastic-like [Pyrus x bretschneideri]
MATLSLSSTSPPTVSLYNVSSSGTATSKFSAFQLRSAKLSCLRLSSLHRNPLRVSIGGKKEFMVMKGKRRGSGAMCYAAPLSVNTLQFVSTISSAILLLAKGTAVQKSFLVPLFLLQAPDAVISWIKSEYGFWTAFLALLVRLFFFIPGELELPLTALLLVIVAPHQVLHIRGRQEGAIIALVVAAYLAFQHFSRIGSLRRSFERGSIIATIAIISITVLSCLFLF